MTRQKTLIVLLTLLAAACGEETESLNRVIYDNRAGENILYGYCDKIGLKKDPFSIWYLSGYNDYMPDKSAIESIKLQKPEEYHFYIAMGSWCHDSQREVPHFMKILNEIGVDEKSITLVGLDRSMSCDIEQITTLDIQRVPTFIVFKNTEEVGRIIETPNATLEIDLLQIVKLPERK